MRRPWLCRLGLHRWHPQRMRCMRCGHDVSLGCVWPNCHRAATVAYVGGEPWPVYCDPHADEMDAVDAAAGFRGAKVRV